MGSNAVVFTNRMQPINVLICRYSEMFHRENELPENERMNVVVIATPTATHFNIALLALEVRLALFSHAEQLSYYVRNSFVFFRGRSS